MEDVRTDRLGTALRRLAEDLIDERRTVALLRRENRELRERLERLQQREAKHESTADRLASTRQ